MPGVSHLLNRRRPRPYRRFCGEARRRYLVAGVTPTPVISRFRYSCRWLSCKIGPLLNAPLVKLPTIVARSAFVLEN
jgi:hypothetical protein